MRKLLFSLAKNYLLPLIIARVVQKLRSKTGFAPARSSRNSRRRF